MRFPGGSKPELTGQLGVGIKTEGETNVTGWTVLLGELENSRGDRTGHSSAPDRDSPLTKHQGPRPPLPHPHGASKAVRTIKLDPLFFFKLDPLDYPNLITGNKQFGAETFKSNHDMSSGQ